MTDKAPKRRLRKRALRAPQGPKLWMEKSMQDELPEATQHDAHWRPKAA